MTIQHGFELVREQDIAELNTRARLFRHVKTGAQLLSMENDDENKVFGISFLTPPEDSTGIAHILEHSVLCGSRKYPVKEPFIELVKGSMKTFLNAMTYPDKTCYPVASTNTQDFYNLVDVYLDAVFYPRITPEILMQEGWHYELENPDDALIFKGVVFNEMKGAYSSPDNLLGRTIQQSLLPDTVYGVDSGGDPTIIPNLTYPQFKRFHEQFYHPSNALIYFYGDDDPEERLRIMDSWLRDFDAIEVPREIGQQEPFDAPQRVVLTYNAGEGDEAEKKSHVAVNWLLGKPEDAREALTLSVLAYILVGTQASPLRKALIDSGLGEDLTGSGVEDDIREAFFTTGLKGVAVEDADRVEALILSTLEKLADEGIDRDMVEAAMNTVEFRLRENNTGAYPRGLILMLRALQTWLYGDDPLERVAFEKPLNALKEELARNPRLFEDLIRERLLNNRHRSTVLLKPDPEQAARDEARERDRLAQVKESLDEAQVREIIETTRRLKAMQEAPDSPEALAKIPRLALSDLDKEVKTIPLEISEDDGAKILFHDLFTNGIVYLDLGFDVHALPQESLPYLALFSRALLAMGTEDEDYVKLSQRIGRKTGGVSASPLIAATHDSSESTAWLFLRGKGTMAQMEDLLAILRDILLKLKLDNQPRFRQIVLEDKARHEAGLVPSGHQVVNQRLRAHFSEADWASEQIGGVDQLLFLRKLAERVEKDWPSVLEQLEAIRRTLINRNGMVVNVTLDAENWAKAEPQVSGLLAALPARDTRRATWAPLLNGQHEGLTIPAQVNYVGKGANLYEQGYELDGSVGVISNFLRTTYLWDRVRVQGGAYGGFCAFDARTGVWSFLSYRDPNLTETIQVYDRTGEYLSNLDLDEGELTKSIIGTISAMDAYQLPDAKGFTSMVRYLTNESDDYRQQIRDDVLSTTPEDFREFGRAMQAVKEQGIVVVLGSEQAIKNANEKRGGDRMQITKVL